ncbi:MAG: helix-turn-helix domain-containing protein [Oscillospiraceae bacterium]|jgi:transcriptional regulator with XRE-family HTH domain|nr:helix-turn-helix domain-containing protein [Oscillospiraceae bacterium]
MARIIDTEYKNIVGENVRKIRTAKKLSQQALSDKLETLAIYICRGSISRIEDRTRTVTDIEVFGLTQILNVPLEELFRENILV